MKIYMFRTVPLSSSGVLHCTHSTGICHTGLLTACEQDWDGMHTPTRCNNFSNLFWKETLHVSDSSSVHYQEFFTVHTALVYVTRVC
jgi:hypothetical protein